MFHVHGTYVPILFRSVLSGFDMDSWLSPKKVKKTGSIIAVYRTISTKGGIYLMGENHQNEDLLQ